MNGFYFGFLAALSGFLVFWILHVLWFRSFSLKDRLSSLRLLFLLVLPGFLIATAVGFDFYFLSSAPSQLTLSRTDQRLLALSIFISAYLGFLFFYAAIEHSVRIRVMLELYRAPRSELTFNELLGKYRPEEGTQNRLNQLVAGGYLWRDQNYFQLTPKGRVFARLALSGKQFFKIGIGG